MTYSCVGTCSAVTVGDFNGDGKLDLAVAAFDANEVGIFETRVHRLHGGKRFGASSRRSAHGGGGEGSQTGEVPENTLGEHHEKPDSSAIGFIFVASLQ